MRISITQSKQSHILPSLLRAVAALVFWLAVWLAAALLTGQELLIPTPGAVFSAFGALVADAQFWESAAVSLLRIFAGYLGGVVIGVLFAVLTTTLKTADWLLSPAIRVVRATPVASFIIICLLWLGHAVVPAFIAMLMVVPVVWENVCTGIAQTDTDLLEMARAYKLSSFKKLKYIYIPSALPDFRAACITALGLAWKSGIAAEVLCLPKAAIGTNLYYSKIYLETPNLFAWTITVIILSFVLEKGIDFLLNRIGSNVRKGRDAA